MGVGDKSHFRTIQARRAKTYLFMTSVWPKGILSVISGVFFGTNNLEVKELWAKKVL